MKCGTSASRRRRATMAFFQGKGRRKAARQLPRTRGRGKGGVSAWSESVTADVSNGAGEECEFAARGRTTMEKSSAPVRWLNCECARCDGRRKKRKEFRILTSASRRRKDSRKKVVVLPIKNGCTPAVGTGNTHERRRGRIFPPPLSLNSRRILGNGQGGGEGKSPINRRKNASQSTYLTRRKTAIPPGERGRNEDLARFGRKK